MSKKDLIDAVAEATELSKDKAGVAVEAVIKHIEKTMKDGQEVRIPGFGTFKVANRKARKARNPQTGAEMMLKAVAGPQVPGLQESEGHAELRQALAVIWLFPGARHRKRARPFVWAVGQVGNDAVSTEPSCLLAYCMPLPSLEQRR